MLLASHSVKPGSVLVRQFLSVIWLLMVWLGAQAALNELSGSYMETGVDSEKPQVELEQSLSYFQKPCETCEGLVANRVSSDAFLRRSL